MQYVDFKYVAAVAAFAKSVAGILVPLVAVLEGDTHQPFGFSNVTLVKLVQLENAEEPIEVTELGIVTLVKLVQLENA